MRRSLGGDLPNLLAHEAPEQEVVHARRILWVRGPARGVRVIDRVGEGGLSAGPRLLAVALGLLRLDGPALGVRARDDGRGLLRYTHRSGHSAAVQRLRLSSSIMPREIRAEKLAKNNG